MQKLLTIVIPTYNMQAYLNRCLDSLVVCDSLIGLIDVLVVNDGSRDDSSAIAHKYEESYPQSFRVIDKENGNAYNQFILSQHPALYRAFFCDYKS